MTEVKTILGRWKSYFETLLNEENSRTVKEDGLENQGVTREVTREEVVKAPRKMKNSKAAGLDEIPAEAWNSLGSADVDKLTMLMQMIWKEEVMPEEWMKSAITPHLQRER